MNEADFTQPSDTGSAFRIDTMTCPYVYNLGADSPVAYSSLMRPPLTFEEYRLLVRLAQDDRR